MSNTNLNTLLQQLNYAHKNEIQTHVSSLLSNLPTLTPSIGTFQNRNGINVNLLKLQGTIPIYFQRQRYNIPILIWLPEEYPFYPPNVYVVEVNNIAICKNHKHVDSNGKCYAPYLSEWRMPSHNLYDLCNYLATIFGEDPPVCAVQKPQVSPQIQPQIQQHSQPTYTNPYAVSQNTQNPMNSAYSQYGSQGYNMPNYTYGTARPNQYYNSNHQQGYGAPSYPYGTTPQTQHQPQTQTQDLKSLVIRKIHAKLNENKETFIRTMRDQEELKSRSILQSNEAKRLEDALKRADSEIEAMKGQISTMESFLDKHLNGEVNVEEIAQVRGVLRQQHLDALAEDAAIDDCIYTLDVELQRGSISTDNYLRTVRQLARTQFKTRALSEKIMKENHAFA